MQEKISDIYVKLSNSKKYSDLTDKELQKKAKELYKFENEFFKESSYEENGKGYFSINDFIHGMDLSYGGRRSQKGMMFDDEYVNTILEYPIRNKDKIVDISNDLYVKVQEYKNLIKYQGNMLNYYPVVNPIKPDIDKDLFVDALKTLEGYNYKTKLSKITKRLLLKDVFYGYEIRDKKTNKRILKEFPFDYCNIIGEDKFGIYYYEIDLQYFIDYQEDLDSFPSEIKKAFNDYKSNKKENRYYIPDTEKQFAFKFDTSIDYPLPFFSGLFVEMVRLQEIKEVQAESSKNENYKLIVFNIPIDEKDGRPDKYLISPKDAAKLHNNAKDNVPEGIGIVTTPLSADSITLKDANETSSNIVDRHFNNLLDSAGVSRLLFNSNSTGSTGIEANMTVDESQMFDLLRQYEKFFERQLYYKYGKELFSVKFLDSTTHNENKVADKYLKASQSGFNKFYTSAAHGIGQLELLYGNEMEDKLGINELLDKPLSSSHVQSELDSNADNNREEGDLTDEGAKSRDKE